MIPMENNEPSPQENSGTGRQIPKNRQKTLDEFVLRCDGGDPSDRDGADNLVSGHKSEDDELPSLTPSIKEIIRLDRGRECELCGRSEDDANLQIHHRTPQSEGGSDHPGNLLLLCRNCHRRHHGNAPIELSNRTNSPRTGESQIDTPSKETEADHASDHGHPEKTQTSPSTDEEVKPLPPRSEPNGADEEILSLIEAEGPLRTGDIAEATDYSKQYIRRQCWKLSGEQLIAPREDNQWDLAERTDSTQLRIGLPETPKTAARAGRDEVIRQMSAHGISNTQIAEITNLSRSTVEIAVNRARALRLEINGSEEEVDLATIATRLGALLELIDHSQID